LTDDLYGHIGSPPVTEFMEQSLSELRINRVNAWWTEEVGSKTWGELKAVELRVEEVGTQKVMWWSTHVPNSFRNGEGEVNIPDGRTIVAWE